MLYPATKKKSFQQVATSERRERQNTVMEETTAAVSMKMPTFMHSAMNCWFAICEAQFKLGHIKNENTKFFYVLSLLPPEVVSSLPSIILALKKYTGLKNAVITRHEKTKPEMSEKLMAKAQMMGKPSKYLHEFMSTASKVGVGDKLVSHKIIQALRPEITLVIAAVKNASLLKLGTLAGTIVPFLKPRMVQNITTPSMSKHTSSTGPMPSITYNTRPFPENQKPRICCGHLYYAVRSRTCKPWCS